jgi:diguanylate cyclase (GGDEF)-like protein
MVAAASSTPTPANGAPGANGGAGPRVSGPALAVLLQNNRQELVADWVRTLKTGTFGGYADVPLDELESSVRQCLAAFIATLRSGDHGRMRRFGRREVRRRLAQGYHESEIDQLVCACRTAASPFIVREYAYSAAEAVDAVNLLQHCIDQAQFEMSDFYQLLAQQQAEEHVAEMEAMNRQLEEISVRDGLTSLYNRRYFQDRLEQEFHRGERHLRPVSLVMMDIDHFKRVNDTYGHPVGDEVLKGVARLLLEQTRTIDIAGRYGGEEFALVLPETPLADAQGVAERIRERVAATVLHRIEKEGVEAELLRCTISLGVASFSGAGYTSPADFLHAADAALYAAKHGGRNRVETAA